MRPTTGEEYGRTSRRSWIALAAGIVLIAGAVFLSMRRLASDVLTTVAGIAGFIPRDLLWTCYSGRLALLNNREPEEKLSSSSEPLPQLSLARPPRR